MDIDVLKSLVAAVETGSFSRAATSLYISQSAVSKRVKMLEDKLGLALLDRSGPLLQLTPAGRIVVKNAKAIIDVCCRCTEELRQFRQARNVSFCCTPAFGLTYLPKIVRAFMEQRPDVSSFSFTFDNPEKIMDGLQSGAFQMAVVEHCDFFPLQGTVIDRLPDDVMLLVGPASLGGQSLQWSLDQLLAKNICVRSNGCCSRLILEDKVAAAGRSMDAFSRVLTYDDLNMILEAVLEGDGVGYVARNVVEKHLADGSMVVLEVPGFEQVFHRSLLVGPSFQPSQESDDLIRLIHEITC